jgi:hypothetical protein
LLGQIFCLSLVSYSECYVTIYPIKMLVIKLAEGLWISLLRWMSKVLLILHLGSSSWWS